MVAVFLARYWDETQPLDPALMPDHCHRCHVSVARRAGLLTAGPCCVLCPECFNRLPAVAAAGQLLSPRQLRLVLLRAVLVILGYVAAAAGIIILLLNA